MQGRLGDKKLSGVIKKDENVMEIQNTNVQINVWEE